MQPAAPPLSVMPRFETWSYVVAAIVAEVGYGDPIAREELKGVGDVELAEMRELVNALGPTAEEVAAGKLSHEWKFSEIAALVLSWVVRE